MKDIFIVFSAPALVCHELSHYSMALLFQCMGLCEIRNFHIEITHNSKVTKCAGNIEVDSETNRLIMFLIVTAPLYSTIVLYVGALALVISVSIWFLPLSIYISMYLGTAFLPSAMDFRQAKECIQGKPLSNTVKK